MWTCCLVIERLNTLYISYDGMLEPLGQTQVLAYLEVLAADYCIHLISFEKPANFADKRAVAALRDRTDAAGIQWITLTYHKTPSALATGWDILLGAVVTITLVLRHRIRIIHVRSYVPALMALAARRLTNAKLLFDIRGFWVDERVDGGLWPANGWLYRSAKRIEKVLFRSADHIVTLTHASAREIEAFPYFSGRAPPVSVIPTCADLGRFCIGRRDSHDHFVLGYLGSIGTWYLFEETLRCFRALCEVTPSARMLVVNRSQHDLIYSCINHAGIDPYLVDVRAADHADVVDLVRRMSAGTALIKPVYSKLASAPTKLAEYLGCGVPCLANAGVGDMKEILEDAEVGVVLSDFSDQALIDGMKRLLRLVQNPDTPHRCRKTAMRLFSLQIGTARYREIYEQIQI
jgi:glycosyltransferase involved in cell wall biosynthesis